MAFGWQYAEYFEDWKVIFELCQFEQKTQILFKTETIASFPKIKEFSLQSMQAEWTELLNIRLRDYIADFRRN